MSRASITGWRRGTARRRRTLTSRPAAHARCEQQLASRGVEPGDELYVLGNDDDRLIMIGRMTVDEPYGLEEARARWGLDAWDATWTRGGEGAMSVAEEAVRTARWTTIDRTAETRSWDFEVSGATDSARVEVKGSTCP